MCVCGRGGGKGRKEGGRRERGGEHVYTNGVVTVVSKLW